MRTFDRATFDQARGAWKAGEFGREWIPYRQAMAERGWLWPPAGTRHDDWGAEEPSQRAVIYQAIEERPKALMSAIGRSRSWSDAIAQLLADRRGQEETIRLAEDDARWERRDEATREQATEALRRILRRVEGPDGTGQREEAGR